MAINPERLKEGIALTGELIELETRKVELLKKLRRALVQKLEEMEGKKSVRRGPSRVLKHWL